MNNVIYTYNLNSIKIICDQCGNLTELRPPMMFYYCSCGNKITLPMVEEHLNIVCKSLKTKEEIEEMINRYDEKINRSDKC